MNPPRHCEPLCLCEERSDEAIHKSSWIASPSARKDGGRLVVFFLAFFFSSLLSASTIENSSRYQHTLKMLRCVVCQNQDLLDSEAPLALELKRKVGEMMEDGHSDTEIFNYLSERYGDFILFKPPVKPLTWVLWFTPILTLLLALAGVYFFVVRQKRV